MDKENPTRKNLYRTAFVLGNLILASGTILAGCNGGNGGEVTIVSEPTNTPRIGTAIQPESTSITTIELATKVKPTNFLWNQDQLVIYQNQFPVEELIVTQHQTPPFYEGSQPLTFSRFREMQLSSGISSIEIVYADEFENFINFYVYDGIFLIGAQTYKDDELVAEARLEYSPKGEMLQPDEVILYEVHYDSSGNVIFTGKSEVDFNTSLKVKELETEGQKQQEYYFLVPLQ